MVDYSLEGVKWGSAGLGGSGGTVTWSFATFNYASRPYTYDPAPGSEFLGLIRKAFDRWEAIANIDFTEVGDAATNQIRVGFDTIDGAGGSLGEASYRYDSGADGIGRLVTADIRFEGLAEGWTKSGATLLSRGGGDFYALALHEIGHAIGLGHVSGPLVVMNPLLSPSLHDLTPADMAGAVAVYGPSKAALAGGQVSVHATHRFYEARTGEHFYTANPAERDNIIATMPNFAYEGPAWAVPDKAAGTIDAFRFFNVQTKTHFFTTSATERDVIRGSLPDYAYEGVGFQVWDDATPRLGTVVLERFYNSRTALHHFALPDEAIAIRGGSAGPNWVDEGPGFRVSALGADTIF